MKPTMLALALASLLISCASGSTKDVPAPDERVVARGLNFEPYTGSFSGYRPLDEALGGMESAATAALLRMEARLGISPDPERPRLVQVRDDAGTWYTESRVIGGRSVQGIVLPAAALAQGRVELESLLLQALTHAVLDDRRFADLPRWFGQGAPHWIAGTQDRALTERLLAGEVPEGSTESLLPGFDPLLRDPVDELSAAFFLAYLAETFGARVLPELAVTLSGASSVTEGLAAALPHDPESLEAGFETYRIMRVSSLVEDPFVVEILAARGLPAAERVVRLSGLAPRASDPVIGAVAAEDLGQAQFEAGDFPGAARTLARVEREYPREGLFPDRDRFLFAMTFARQEQEAAAALRFENFLQEFPQSSYAPRALFELAGLMLESGRPEDAMARFAELQRRFPESPYARKGLVVLAAYELARHRYARAREYLQKARPDPRAAAALIELDETLAAGLPAAAEGAVRDALRDLASPDEARGRAGIAALQAIGPVSGELVLAAAAGDVGGSFGIRLTEAVTAWGLPGATPVLMVELSSGTREQVEAAFAALSTLGATPGTVRQLLDSLGSRSPLAEAVWIELYGGGAGVPEVAGLMDDEDFERRAEAAAILGTLDRPEAVTALAGLLKDPSPAVRRAAANALGNHSSAEAAAALELALRDEAVSVRLEAVDGLARLGVLAPVRKPGLEDEDGSVRLAAAGRLLEAGRDEDFALVVAVLSEPEGGVASGVEALLRGCSGPAYEGALVAALVGTEDPGMAMRVVRLMCRRVGQDLGYDPGEGAAERERVAAAFVELVKDR